MCTAGTAVSNFLPGITEAYFQELPIFAITADSSAYLLGQLKLQKIPQQGIFEGVIKKQFTLPIVLNNEDEWACNRMVNEAIISLSHHGCGPVHINIPITQSLECNVKVLQKQRIIKRYTQSEVNYAELDQKLHNKKVMVIVGQGLYVDEELQQLCNRFYQRYNCFFSIETISNIRCDGVIATYPITETGMLGIESDFVPDVVISIGNHIASYNMEGFLKKNRNQIENWLISEGGNVRDPYWSLTKIIEGSVKDFLSQILKEKRDTEEEMTDKFFYHNWYNLYKKCILETEQFSSLSVARILAKTIPEKSILHTAVLNSTRVMQFSDYVQDLEATCYCNLGALGIDGCVATFMGEAWASDNLAYLLIGDLSFFYGMNGISISGIKNNVRIILLNNGGGEEFKIKMNYPQMERYICAKKKRYTKGWVEDCGFKYYFAESSIDVENVLNIFARPSEKPLFLEVELDMDKDAEIIKNLYKNNKATESNPVRNRVKSEIVKIVSPRYIDKLKEIYKIMKA